MNALRGHRLPEDASDELLDYMLDRTEPGAIPCGTRVKKGPTRDGDIHPEGSLATVRGSCGPISHEGEDNVYGYLLEFDDTPHAYVLVHDGQGRLRVVDS
jgi:hypothetical protein